MTASGAVRPRWKNYAVANLVAGIVTPLRAPRGRANLVPAWRRFALPGLIVAVLVAAAMMWVDAPVMRAVTRLPSGVIETAASPCGACMPRRRF